jgi:lipopolysaccharide transport system ATP-binding protein
MTDVVIRAEGLGKKYLIGHQAEAERYTALRDVIARGARGLARSAADMLRGRPLPAGDTVEELWALKDVSFEVKRGEVLGIIGRNGAGKSTLLKILSRITEPSAGRVTIKGRVASLLEVGTGFHPELTGRENVYLNGAILGMTRAEIRRKFDAIVAFAEVEKFLDTPVKRYSSGMYVRLAFAVAAHLEPEILVVDEVLAVGDAEFQKRCLGKMGEVASGGRTVLFVSHNMGAVSALCVTGIHLHRGSVATVGPAAEVVAAYIRTTMKGSRSARQLASSTDLGLIESSIEYGVASTGAQAGLLFHLTIQATRAISASIDFRFKDALGLPIAFASLGSLDPSALVTFRAGVNKIVVEIPLDGLARGNYGLSIDLTSPGVSYYDRAEDCLTFTVDSPNLREAQRPMQQTWGYGSFRLPARLIAQSRVGVRCSDLSANI